MRVKNSALGWSHEGENWQSGKWIVLFCWGHNDRGQLGNTSFLDSARPVEVWPAAADWSQISAGGAHTCAVKTDGRLFCWGATAVRVGFAPVWPTD